MVASKIELEMAFMLVTRIASLSIIVTTLEDLVNFKVFNSQGLLSWKIVRMDSLLNFSGVSGRAISFFMEGLGLKITFFIRLISVVILLFTPSIQLSWLFTLTIFASLVLISLRNTIGLDGAHQMQMIIFFGLTLGNIFLSAKHLSLWFIAIQLVISYNIAGVAKLISKPWRSGSAITDILGTTYYGNPILHKFLSDYPVIAIILSWYVIMLETFFGVIFLLPKHMALILAFFGLLLHLGIAIAMRLNKFLFAFSAAYPALLFCVFV